MKTLTAPQVEVGFGYSYHAHQIPPYRPEHALFLGYGDAVTPTYMRQVYGPCKITAVDKAGFNPNSYIEHENIKADAADFVRDATAGMIKTRFDYIAVDLWEGTEVCPLIYEPEFAAKLKQMCTNKLSINQPKDDFHLLEPYYNAGFVYDRSVEAYGNRVSWWSVI